MSGSYCNDNLVISISSPKIFSTDDIPDLSVSVFAELAAAVFSLGGLEETG